MNKGFSVRRSEDPPEDCSDKIEAACDKVWEDSGKYPDFEAEDSEVRLDCTYYFDDRGNVLIVNVDGAIHYLTAEEACGRGRDG